MDNIQNIQTIIRPYIIVVLLTVFRYAEYHFALVEKTKSAKNIWEPVIENVIILGFLMAETKIYIFCKICHSFTLY